MIVWSSQFKDNPTDLQSSLAVVSTQPDCLVISVQECSVSRCHFSIILKLITIENVVQKDGRSRT